MSQTEARNHRPIHDPLVVTFTSTTPKDDWILSKLREKHANAVGVLSKFPEQQANVTKVGLKLSEQQTSSTITESPIMKGMDSSIETTTTTIAVSTKSGGVLRKPLDMSIPPIKCVISSSTIAFTDPIKVVEENSSTTASTNPIKVEANSSTISSTTTSTTTSTTPIKIEANSSTIASTIGSIIATMKTPIDISQLGWLDLYSREEWVVIRRRQFESLEFKIMELEKKVAEKKQSEPKWNPLQPWSKAWYCDELEQHQHETMISCKSCGKRFDKEYYAHMEYPVTSWCVNCDQKFAEICKPFNDAFAVQKQLNFLTKTLFDNHILIPRT